MSISFAGTKSKLHKYINTYLNSIAQDRQFYYIAKGLFIVANTDVILTMLGII